MRRGGGETSRDVAYWKFFATIAFVALAAATVAVISSPSFPRPVLFFIAVAFSVVALYAWIVIDAPVGASSGLFIGAVALLSFLLRWTAYRPLAASSSDQISHYSQRAGHILEHGYVGPFGIYEHSPLIHIFIATLNKLAGYTNPPDAIVLMAAMAAFVPLLIGAVLYRLGDQKTGLHGMLLAAIFPLFLRTGAIYETEALALPYFVLLIYGSLLGFDEHRRAYLCLLLVGVASVFVHFFYPFILLGVILAGAVLYYELPDVRRDLDQPLPGLIGSALFLLVLYRVITTERGAGLFVSMLLERSGSSLPNSPLQLLLPSAGAVADSTATATTPLDVAGNFAPALLLVVLGVIGGIFSLAAARYRDKYQAIIVFAAVTAIGTLVGLVAFSSASSMALGFRIYYFAGVFVVVFGAVAMIRLPEIATRAPPAPIVVMAVLAVMMLVVGGLAPMSSLGNNVEPWFGSSPNAVTGGDAAELRAMDQAIPGENRTDDIELDRIHLPPDTGPFAPSLPSTYKVVSASEDCVGNRVWSGTHMAVCERFSR